MLAVYFGDAFVCRARLSVLLAACVFTGPGAALSAPWIVNEFNAVSSSRQLGDGDGADSFFGTIDGNGGNWIELLVIQDNLDVRGWKLAWNEDEDGDDTLAGNTVGEITLSNALLWSNLRAGTLVTIIERPDAGGFDTSTDTSFNPAAGDWTINVSTREEQGKGAAGLLQTTTNDGDPGDFSVGNDNWSISLFDETDSLVFGPLGEGETSWQGGNINSREAGSLEGPGLGATLADWQAISPSSDFYDDTAGSSFGGYNVDFDGGVFTQIQDPSALQSLVIPEPSSIGFLSLALLVVACKRR